MKLLIENWRNFINEEEEFSPEEKILQIYNSGGRDNRLLAREMAKTFGIDFAEMQKDYKQKILTMLKKPQDADDVPKAIELYKSVGMGNFLEGADLTDINFEGIDLSGANLRYADLTRANLRGADLTGAVLTGAFFDGIEYDENTKWPDSFKITE